MDDEQKKNYYMNRNIKLYPTYLAFTWDIFFCLDHYNAVLHQCKRAQLFAGGIARFNLVCFSFYFECAIDKIVF